MTKNTCISFGPKGRYQLTLSPLPWGEHNLCLCGSRSNRSNRPNRPNVPVAQADNFPKPSDVGSEQEDAEPVGEQGCHSCLQTALGIRRIHIGCRGIEQDVCKEREHSNKKGVCDSFQHLCRVQVAHVRQKDAKDCGKEAGRAHVEENMGYVHSGLQMSQLAQQFSSVSHKDETSYDTQACWDVDLTNHFC